MAGMRYRFAEPVHVAVVVNGHGLVDRSFDEGIVAEPPAVDVPDRPDSDDAAAVDRYERDVAASAERDATVAALEHLADIGFAERIEDLPGLSNLKKAELLRVADSEHVDVAQATTNDEIRDAIEKARAAADAGGNG